MEILLITAAIDVSKDNVPFTKITNTQERLSQYIQSIIFAINNYNQIHTIIFCENTNYLYDYSDLISKAKDKDKILEILLFKGKTEVYREKGKGYGEGEIFIWNLFTYVVAFFQFFIYEYQKKFDKNIIEQKKNFKNIPIIIINFNQLFYLQKLIDALIKRQYFNIIIIDNNSTYKPLLKYYDEIAKKNIIVEKLDQNVGHLVLYSVKKLLTKYVNGYYFLTDADIVPNNNLPEDFALKMIEDLENNNFNITKVGFALDLEDIPETYPLKQKVIDWEKKFWDNQIGKYIYKANVDTTFALYRPYYKKYKYQNNFVKGLRLAGEFTAKHGGWYLDRNNLSDESIFYSKHANNSASWIFDE